MQRAAATCVGLREHCRLRVVGATIAVVVMCGIQVALGFGAPLLYFGDNEDAGRLWVLDTGTLQSKGMGIRVGNGPRGVAVNPAGTRAYVANYGVYVDYPFNVTVIDTTTQTIADVILIPQPSRGIYPQLNASAVAVSPDGKRLYVSHRHTCAGGDSDTVSVIDTATNDLITTFPVGASPRSIAVTPDGERVYVANQCGDTTCGNCGPSSTRTISVIHTATNQVFHRSGLPNPSQVVVSPDGSRLYVRTGGSIRVLDTTTHGELAPIPTGCLPRDIAVNPLGTRLYATCGLAPSVSGLLVIDTSTNAVLETIPTPYALEAIAVSPDSGRVYVVGPPQDSVSVLDASTNQFVATVPVTEGASLRYTFGSLIGPPSTCGDGHITSAEQCDDGNVDDDDGCSSACVITPGFSCSGAPSVCVYAPPPMTVGRTRRPEVDDTGCLLQWRVVHAKPALNRFGMPDRRQTCLDGDPGCDFKPEKPGTCKMQVALCLNTTDPRLPACTPTGVSDVSMVTTRMRWPGPRYQTPDWLTIRAANAANELSIENALNHLFDPQNPAAGFIARLPLDGGQQGFCSQPFMLDIPIADRQRWRAVTITLRGKDGRSRPRRFSSKLRLTCVRSSSP